MVVLWHMLKKAILLQYTPSLLIELALSNGPYIIEIMCTAVCISAVSSPYSNMTFALDQMEFEFSS